MPAPSLVRPPAPTPESVPDTVAALAPTKKLRDVEVLPRLIAFKNASGPVAVVSLSTSVVIKNEPCPKVTPAGAAVPPIATVMPAALAEENPLVPPFAAVSCT